MLNKEERAKVAVAIESIAGAIQNGDYPAIEARFPLVTLCSMLENWQILAMVEEDLHPILFALGGVSKEEDR